MKLLNCRQCDDVVKLVERVRSCECGRSTGRLDPREVALVVTGPARVFEIPWSEYDQADAGTVRRVGVEWRRWHVVPR